MSTSSSGPRRAVWAVRRGLAALAMWCAAIGAWLVYMNGGTTIVYLLGIGGFAAQAALFALAAVMTGGVLLGLVGPASRLGRPRSILAGTGITLGLVAMLAVVALAGLFAIVTADTFTRFDAADGSAYLLRTENSESGMLAVYRRTSPVTYTLLPAFGERYSLPGAPPCTPRATDTQIVVQCSDGAPSISPR